ncbi:MAG TPA: sugar transferase [Candidatus Limnocylindria bacterium]|nr:sugar transferase [Candidatus Limnocylindria bacterium]
MGQTILADRAGVRADPVVGHDADGLGSDVVAAAPTPSMYALCSRALDIVLGTALTIVALPVMAVVAVLVRLDSPGPVIFSQRRVGLAGRPFTFYKFRTMRADARARFPDLYAYRYTEAEIEQMYFKIFDDPRLTRLGRRLRKTSLDELPNLLCVLRGDMALVGPRPELPEMVRYYRPEQLPKFSVKPGVTGLAQVTGRGILRFQDTIAADLEYVRRRSFAFDIEILLRTIRSVVTRVGAF